MPAEKTVLMLPTEDPQDALLDDDALIKSVRDAIGPLRNRLGARIEVLLPDRKRVKVQQGQLRKEFKEREGMLDAEMRFVDRRIKSLNNAYASITNGKLYTNKRNRPGGRVKLEPVTVEWLTEQLNGGRKCLSELCNAAQKRHLMGAIVCKLQEHPELFHGEMLTDVQLPFPWNWELEKSRELPT